MVRACIDPTVAAKVWEKMSQRGLHDHEHDDANDKKKTRIEVPTILSTHPHDKTRAAYLGELAPEKAVAYHAAGCGHVSEHVLRMGRRALLEKEAAARHAKLQAKE